MEPQPIMTRVQGPELGEETPLAAPSALNEETPEPPPFDLDRGLYYVAGGWRNGREAGAWASGLVCAHQGSRVHVQFEKDHVDGATTSLVRAGVTVRPYSTTSSGEWVTLELWIP